MCISAWSEDACSSVRQNVADIANLQTGSKSGAMVLFVFKQKTAYEMRISDGSSDVCSSDLPIGCCSRCIIVEYAIATGSAQRVELERQLLVCGRDARIADQRHMLPDRVRFPIILRSCPNRHHRSRVDGHKIGRAHV